jgi:hypothetical protein
MTKTRKVYDFPLEKVEGDIVTFLKKRRNESTIADMMAGTGLPKYQIEQAIKQVLDEYAGHLKATDSGEILYYFPSGMKSTRKGFGPVFKRFWKGFVRGAARVLAFLFKIWIVAMLIGYFVVFIAIMVLAVVAAFAGSAAGGRGRESRSRRGDGLGAMFIVIRLLDFALRMWIYSSFLQNIQGASSRKRRPPGRPFYKSVFGFVFGEGDPNANWETTEKTNVISYIRGNRGVITIEELMALTGKDSEEAQTLINRYLLEFEGDPGVTDNGTLIYSFPELLRTTESEQKTFGTTALFNPPMKSSAPFSANKKGTNGWISFFNAFNLLFGGFFLGFSVTHGTSIVAATGSAASTDLLSFIYSVTYNLLSYANIPPVPFMAIILGIIPVSFSIVFFIVPIIRKILLNRKNQKIREENLRKKIIAQILANPEQVDPRALQAIEADATPRKYETVRKRIIDRFAALKAAEPVQMPDGSFIYRFPELKREIADLEEYRKKVDLKSFEVGKTVFDSGQ